MDLMIKLSKCDGQNFKAVIKSLYGKCKFKGDLNILLLTEYSQKCSRVKQKTD